MKKFRIRARDGYELGALYGTPVGQGIGTVVISSATAIKKEFYIHFAQYLIQNGYNVLLYDYRGVGESAPEKLKNSGAFIHEWGTLDMNAVLDYLVGERGHSGIIWLGHSIGAQLTGFLSRKEHVKKIVAVNAALGYWGYFPFPKKMQIWALWYLVSPVMVKLYGYGTMKKLGWGEDLPKNVLMEWRNWCLNRHYYRGFLEKKLNTDKFYDFHVPFTFVYTSDDYIANEKTTPLMMQFFPNAPASIVKLDVAKHSKHKAGHTGIFRKKFEKDLWVQLVRILEE